MGLKVLQLCAVDFTVRHFLLPLLHRLEREDFQVTMMCSKGAFFDGLIEDGIDMKELPISRSWNVFSHLSCIFNLRRFLKENHYDIVHTHTPIASLIGRIAARTCGVPIVLYSAHGFYFHADMSRLARLFHVSLEKFGAGFCDFIFTQSDEDRKTALKERIISEDRILTIGNGVDLSRFNPDAISPEAIANVRDELGIPDSARVIAMIGRLVREKGYFEFFEAAAHILKKYPETIFLVIGDVLESDHDDSKRELHDLIDNLGIRKSVIFTGMRKDVETLLAATDIYTLPSYREGMPRSIIEAMAMGKPVVTTDIRGCREEVVDRETGLIVPPKDAPALARALLTLLEDDTMRNAFGEKARYRARDVFSEDIVLDRQMEVYRRLMAEKGLEEKR